MSSLDKEVERIMGLLSPGEKPPCKTAMDTPWCDLPESPSKTASDTPWYELPESELTTLIQDNISPEEIRHLKHLIDSAKSCDAVDLQHPFSMTVAGPSGAGKTHLIKRILESDIISPEPKKVVWCYAEYQPLYDEMKEAGLIDEFVEGLDFETHVDGITPTLLVIDDLQDETSSDSTVANLFKRGCHHRNLSVMFLVQNLYFHGKKSVDIRRNSLYVVVFKNPQDKLQIQRFAQSAFPGKVAHIMQLYEALGPHEYLLFDFTQEADDDVRIRTGITKGESLQCFSVSD